MTTQRKSFTYRQLSIACFFVAAAAASFAYMDGGLPALATATTLMMLNLGLLVGLYWVAEGIWPLGRHRVLDLYTHIVICMYLFEMVPRFVIKVVPAPYIPVATSAGYLLGFMAHWFIPDRWSTRRGSQSEA